MLPARAAAGNRNCEFFLVKSSQVIDRLPYGCLLFMYRLDLTFFYNADPSGPPSTGAAIAWTEA